MAQELILRGYQQHGIELFGKLAHPPRHFFTWDMGAGKTIGAFSIAQTYTRKRVLIVCPAIVRGTWLREIGKHWPHVKASAITVGRNRALSKKQAALREEAYACDVQVISYDLLPHVEAEGWDLIIVDEFHNLRNPSSKQSKMMRALFRANPDAWAIGLSGTPIPNEAQQLWNPVNTFFPQMWGKISKTFRTPWAFLSRFCEVEQNEYGTRFFGLKEENRDRLEQEFGKVSFRVVQADFAKYLPPLFVEPLHLDQAKDTVALALEWYESVKDECPHMGIYTHLRATAEAIAAAIPGAFLITGKITPATRDIALAEMRGMSSSVLVGTTHALKEGISLSFQKAALVVEWTTAVDEVTQFIARFARQDSTCQMPTRVQFVVGPTDHGRAEVLSQRIENIQKLVKPSRADGLAADTFAAVEMSDESFQSELSRLIESQQRRAALWSAEEDDDDGDE
ncbi:MAG TPA: SNF2-related protein [Verrucomicrobiae bacterium]|nr:SNF2-related protein [Verrucomicrobiae bacterium]